MDVSSISTQSTAVAAYAAQLTARERTPAANGGVVEEPGKPQTPSVAPQPASEEVTLSAEARRLATPPSGEAAGTGGEAENSARDPASDATNAVPASAAKTQESPDDRAATAKSVAQAINAYLETSAV